MKVEFDKINRSNLENYLDFTIEGYDYFPYEDLSDAEIEIILKDISDGITYGSFKTLSGKTDDEVLLTWEIK